MQFAWQFHSDVSSVRSVALNCITLEIHRCTSVPMVLCHTVSHSHYVTLWHTMSHWKSTDALNPQSLPMALCHLSGDKLTHVHDGETRYLWDIKLSQHILHREMAHMYLMISESGNMLNLFCHFRHPVLLHNYKHKQGHTNLRHLRFCA